MGGSDIHLSPSARLRALLRHVLAQAGSRPADRFSDRFQKSKPEPEQCGNAGPHSLAPSREVAALIEHWRRYLLVLRISVRKTARVGAYGT